MILALALGLSACSGSSPTRSPAPTQVLVPDSQLLGDPAAFPAGDADKAAATLANSVVHGGAQAMPALLAAIRGSGFGIRDLSVGGRIVVVPAAPSQGLAFQAGEVYTMGKLLARGYSVSLADVVEIARALDVGIFASAPVKAFLVAGIRSAATSSRATLRLWARFIIEIGRKAAHPYDLMTAAPDDAELNVVQTQFILLRLFGDAYGKIQPAAPAGTTQTAARIQLAADTKPLCNPGEREAEILEATSVGAAFGFEQFWDWAAEHIASHTLHGVVEKIPYINAILGMMRFIATMVAFTAKVEIDKQPLERTKTTKAGQLGRLTLRASVESDKSPFVNCLRLIFNGAGLDFSLPNGGKIEGAEITWTMLSGNRFVELCSEPCDDHASGKPDSIRHGHTNDEGEATVGVEGVAQKVELPKTVKPVGRHAVVRAGVNLKPANLVRDLIDAAGAAGAGGAGLVIFPAELLARVGAYGAGVGFDVTDWGETWKIVATVHAIGQNASGFVDYNWLGTVDVDADGVVSGEGTGLLSGRPSCEGGVGATTASGVYGVVFGGTKKGDRFNLRIKGTAPSIQVGHFGASCNVQYQAEVNLLTSLATDPARFLTGGDLFTFDAAGGQFSGAVGEASATLHLSATQQ